MLFLSRSCTFSLYCSLRKLNIALFIFHCFIYRPFFFYEKRKYIDRTNLSYAENMTGQMFRQKKYFFRNLWLIHTCRIGEWLVRAMFLFSISPDYVKIMVIAFFVCYLILHRNAVPGIRDSFEEPGGIYQMKTIWVFKFHACDGRFMKCLMLVLTFAILLAIIWTIEEIVFCHTLHTIRTWLHATIFYSLV